MPRDKKACRAFATNIRAKSSTLTPNQALVWFDEFSINDRPSASYGWAPVNTRPKIKSNEKRVRKRTTGMLAVDQSDAQMSINFANKGNARKVAFFMLRLAKKYAKMGKEQVFVVLDNAKTHKTKMRGLLDELMQKTGLAKKIKLKFIDTPAYSPDLNLAEYQIQLIRKEYLHDHPPEMELNEIKQRLRDKLEHEKLQTPKQLQNTIQHIYNKAA